MARIYTQNDRLIDVLDFLDVYANPCQEAKDWCRALGDITMGEFMDTIDNNPEFEPSWIAYSMLTFPKLMNAFLMLGFEQEMNRSPRIVNMVQQARARKGHRMEVEDNA